MRASSRFTVAFTLALTCALPILVACASSSGRSGSTVGGLFDPGESDNEGYREERAYGGGGGGGGGYATQGAPSYAPPPAPPTEPMPTAAKERIDSDESYSGVAISESVSTIQSAPGSVARDVFDFAGDVIEGALARPSGDKSAAAPNDAQQKAPDPSLPKAGEPVKGDKPPVESSAAKRLVIYKGSLVVLVAAVEPAVEKLSARANELGGYVENQSGNSASNNATITMRVPADKFYALVNELGTYGQVTQKNVTASDVTKTVFDIELRLETAEKSRQRLLDLLKSATKMDEILQIENEVRRLTQEIEGMKGELRFLKDQVSFSTLAVTFYSNAPPPNQGPTRTRSRFEWINQVGVESVLYNF